MAPLSLPPTLAQLVVPDFDYGVEYFGKPLFADAAPYRTFITDTSHREDFAKRLSRALPAWRGRRIFVQEDAYESFHSPTIGKPGTFDDLELGVVHGILGPETGEWVIVINDEWQAVVGATSEDLLEAFESAFGPRRQTACEFIDYWHDFEDVMRTDWLVPLLEHMLPAEEAHEILANEGRWLVDVSR